MTHDFVHIVDDDDAIRDALSWLFQSRKVATAEYDSAEAFLAAWSPAMTGCVLLDLRMDGMSGLELFDRLRELACSLPVIFLTGHGDVPVAVDALKKGAFDFVEKPFNDNELVDKVVAACALSAQRRTKDAERLSVAARLATLSPRERAVMDQILSGRLNKQIADELGISMRTVEVHRAHVFDKMAVRSAVELAQLMVAMG
jgi:two-component system response regulator DctR